MASGRCTSHAGGLRRLNKWVQGDGRPTAPAPRDAHSTIGRYLETVEGVEKPLTEDRLIQTQERVQRAQQSRQQAAKLGEDSKKKFEEDRRLAARWYVLSCALLPSQNQSSDWSHTGHS